jgi:hypothetical protein
MRSMPATAKACDDVSRRGHLEGRDLSGDKPDACEQDQQESHLGEDDSCIAAHDADASYFEGSELLVTTEISSDPRGIPMSGRGQAHRDACTVSALQARPDESR